MHNQTLHFRLKVISPIHIGCDEVYEPTSFVIDEKQQELISFDPFEFVKQLADSERQKFSTICQQGTIVSLLEIYKFIRQHAGLAHGERIAVSPSLVEHYQETMKLPANERRIQQELNNFLISRTSFNPITNLPYVPGSAIKGAIRTAVLNLRNQGRTQPYYQNARAMQEGLLDCQFNKLESDPFRLVKVSDFTPVAKAKRRVAYAVDCKKRPSEREAQALAQILETVEPGAEFIGTLAISRQDAKAGIKKPIDTEEVRKALRAFYDTEKTREDRELQAIGVGAIPMTLGDAICPIRIGRHSGAECVTVLGRRKIKIMQGKGNPPKENEHGATTVWLAADAKKPTNPRSLQPFGWAILEEINEEEWNDLQDKGDKLTAERFTQIQERADMEDQTRKARIIQKEKDQSACKAAEEQVAREAAEKEAATAKERETLAAMSEAERQAHALSTQGITENEVVEIYSRLDSFEPPDQKIVAVALKKYWETVGKWKVKPKQEKQWKKVQKIKAILGEA